MKAKLVLALFAGMLATLPPVVAVAQEGPVPCPPGRQWNPRLQRCMNPPPACPPGADWSPRLKRCISPAKKCPPAMVWVPGQGCRPVPPPVEEPRDAVKPRSSAPRQYPDPPGLPAPGAVMVVQASALNLRDCPVRRCRARAVLEAGQEVRFLDYRHGYALVRVLADNREGWVDLGYLAPAP